jgi:hypothetical protein
VSESTRLTSVAVALLASALTACAVTEFLLEPKRDDLERWTREAEQLRELPFLAPVEVSWIESSEIPFITRAEMLAELPPGFVEAYRDAYAVLGVLPPGIDLIEALTRLQEDQLVGLYSTRLRVMYVVVGDPGSRGYEDTTILLHELVHALQHQHFPQTIALLEGLRRNDDVVSAIASAMEGDASLTMLGARGVPYRSLEAARELSRAMIVEFENPTGVMATVPRFLTTSLMFPYAYGILVAAGRWEEEGNPGLDALMRDPPLSTTRVLFPEDDDPVEFIRLPRQALAAQASARGCELGFDNVAGALTAKVLFEDYGDTEDLTPLLAAWSGDRFLHVDCGEVSEFLWLTRWDDAPSAAQFAERYRAIAPSIAQASGLSDVPGVRLAGRSVLVTTGGLQSLQDVVLAEAEVRSYASLGEWVRDDCFPESPCPKHQPPDLPPTVAGEGGPRTR